MICLWLCLQSSPGSRLRVTNFPHGTFHSVCALAQESKIPCGTSCCLGLQWWLAGVHLPSRMRDHPLLQCEEAFAPSLSFLNKLHFEEVRFVLPY